MSQPGHRKRHSHWGKLPDNKMKTSAFAIPLITALIKLMFPRDEFLNEILIVLQLIPNVLFHFTLLSRCDRSLKTLCPGAASGSPSVRRTAPRSAPWTPCWPQSHPAVAWGLEEKQGWVQGAQRGEALSSQKRQYPPSSRGLTALPCRLSVRMKTG